MVVLLILVYINYLAAEILNTGMQIKLKYNLHLRKSSCCKATYPSFMVREKINEI